MRITLHYHELSLIIAIIKALKVDARIKICGMPLALETSRMKFHHASNTLRMQIDRDVAHAIFKILEATKTNFWYAMTGQEGSEHLLECRNRLASELGYIKE